jgi:hypothetical protein
MGFLVFPFNFEIVWSKNSSRHTVSKKRRFFYADELIEGTGDKFPRKRSEGTDGEEDRVRPTPWMVCTQKGRS